MAPPTKKKKKKPKGKPLSETLRAKDEKKATAAAELDEAKDSDEAEERDESERDGDEREDDEREDDEREDDEREDDEREHDEREHDEREHDEREHDEREHDEREHDNDGKAEADEAEAPASAGGDEAEEHVAAAMGFQRYVILGFLALWLVVSYVAGRAVQGGWGEIASRPKLARSLPGVLAEIPHEGELISRESISLMLGAIVGGAITFYYYRRADVRRWADEVAEEISKVKWPTRKEIGSYTVIVITASAILTAYLTLLDRFWSFVTNLIYSSGA
jgi:preprotein translocase subunit SecE